MIKNGDSLLKGSAKYLGPFNYERYKSTSEDSESKKKNSEPKQLTEEQRQEIVTRMLASTSKPNGANRPYGTGETIGSAGVAVVKTGQVNHEFEHGFVAGETTFLEARARTYHTKTAVGAEAQASLVRVEYGAKGSVPLVQAGETEIVGAGGYARGEVFVGAQGNAQAGAGMKGILPYAAASAAGFAGARVVVTAGGEVRLLGVGLRLDGEGHAWAGAQGSAEASISPTGIKAGVEGFAGAEAGVSGTASIGGIGVSGEANAYAGAGGKAGVAIGLTEDGEITVSAELGGAVGVGAGAGLSVSIDTDQLIEDGANLFKTASDLASQAADGIGEAMESAGEAAEDTAETVAETAGDVVDAVGDAVGDAGQAASDTAEDVVETVTGWLPF